MLSLISIASQEATYLHGDQRYGELPYHFHLFDAVGALKRFVPLGLLTQELIDAMWLHDVLEDTSTTREYLENMFGKKTADLVFAVSNEPGKNRKERHLKTYPKVRDTKDAIVIKLSDRIANLEHTVRMGQVGLFQMYLKERLDFELELRDRCQCSLELQETVSKMWDHVSSLFEQGWRKGMELEDT